MPVRMTAVKYRVRKLVLTVESSLVGQTEWWNDRAHGERFLCVMEASLSANRSFAGRG
jgi:hypothetical protein